MLLVPPLSTRDNVETVLLGGIQLSIIIHNTRSLLGSTTTRLAQSLFSQFSLSHFVLVRTKKKHTLPCYTEVVVVANAEQSLSVSSQHTKSVSLSCLTKTGY